MPYSPDDIEGLPENVKKMGDKDRRQWVHVWNSVYEKHGSEETAFAEANGVLKKEGKQPNQEETDGSTSKGFSPDDFSGIDIVESDGNGSEDLKGVEKIIAKEIGLPIEVKGLKETDGIEISAELFADDVETKGADMSNSVEVSFRVKGEATRTMPKLIDCIRRLGAPGHSFSIIVDPDVTIEEGRRTFGFDGDGSDYIEDIKVDGVKFEDEK